MSSEWTSQISWWEWWLCCVDDVCLGNSKGHPGCNECFELYLWQTAGMILPVSFQYVSQVRSAGGAWILVAPIESFFDSPYNHFYVFFFFFKTYLSIYLKTRVLERSCVCWFIPPRGCNDSSLTQAKASSGSPAWVAETQALGPFPATFLMGHDLGIGLEVDQLSHKSVTMWYAITAGGSFIYYVTVLDPFQKY